MGHAAPRRRDVAPEVGLGHGGDDYRRDADTHLHCMVLRPGYTGLLCSVTPRLTEHVAMYTKHSPAGCLCD